MLSSLGFLAFTPAAALAIWTIADALQNGGR